VIRGLQKYCPVTTHESSEGVFSLGELELLFSLGELNLYRSDWYMQWVLPTIRKVLIFFFPFIILFLSLLSIRSKYTAHEIPLDKVLASPLMLLNFEESGNEPVVPQ